MGQSWTFKNSQKALTISAACREVKRSGGSEEGSGHSPQLAVTRERWQQLLGFPGCVLWARRGRPQKAALNAASGHLASPIRKIKLREVKQCA